MDRGPHRAVGRLCLAPWVSQNRDAAGMEFIAVGRVDEAGERAEAAYYFDVEDVESAIAALERQHAELDTKAAQPRIR